MEQSVHDRIRERAYHLWDSSGRMAGQAEQHWLCAEREILAQRSLQRAAVAMPSSRPRSRKGSKNGKTG